MEKNLLTLKSLQKHITFAVEVEENSKIPFLDAMTIKYNNKIKIDWYKKQTASGRLTDFDSKHLRCKIRDTAKNFIDRAINISVK